MGKKKYKIHDTNFTLSPERKKRRGRERETETVRKRKRTYGIFTAVR